MGQFTQAAKCQFGLVALMSCPITANRNSAIIKIFKPGSAGAGRNGETLAY
jgi:hypothetical protein